MYAPIPYLKSVSRSSTPSTSESSDSSSYSSTPTPSSQSTRQAKTNRILCLGESIFREKRQRFGLLPDDRLRHLYVLGKTGSGKSTLLANLIAQDLAQGRGLALLDPHGSLVDLVAPLVPQARVNEVLLFNPGDEAFPVSFNVFRQGKNQHPSPSLLTSELISVFKSQWSDSWGPRLEHVLRNGILAVASDPRATLLFLYRFFTDQGLREKVIEKVEDPIVRQFWTVEFPGYKANLQAEALAPVLNKLGAFVGNPLVRNLIGQERSRVDLVGLMNRRGVLLANLATGKIGEDASHLLGGLLYNGPTKLDNKFQEMRDCGKIKIYENTTEVYTRRKSSSSFNGA